MPEEFLLSGHLRGTQGASGAFDDRKAMFLGEIGLRIPEGADSRQGLGLGLKVRPFRGLLDLLVLLER